MPHISKKKLSQKNKELLGEYITSLIRDTGTKTRSRIFNELLTQTEKTMIAKRIAILLFLRKGIPTHKISDLLGVSPSTVGRFQLSTEHNKYHYTVDWIWKQSDEGSLDAFLDLLMPLLFTGKTQSFKNFIDEL